MIDTRFTYQSAINRAHLKQKFRQFEFFNNFRGSIIVQRFGFFSIFDQIWQYDVIILLFIPLESAS